ncbi:predicted protein [Lichtheimia corymbifera JMRC:FSU:9682]|uniref:Uncharacterized protein n=1 Tax=Lichtheimia corymbifera JMRC:FSU:9682 TaxID=1263082 RepID=A0A068RUA3_9FUNG|nr:predicted protein [Lichtheimia corymbifera JMRC:FSU:9682]
MDNKQLQRADCRSSRVIDTADHPSQREKTCSFSFPSNPPLFPPSFREPTTTTPCIDGKINELNGGKNGTPLLRDVDENSGVVANKVFPAFPPLLLSQSPHAEQDIVRERVLRNERGGWLLPFVRCYSRSTRSVNRGQTWLQDVGSFGDLFRLNSITPWFSVPSIQQQRWGLAPSQGTLAPPPAYGLERDTILLASSNIDSNHHDGGGSSSSTSSHHVCIWKRLLLVRQCNLGHISSMGSTPSLHQVVDDDGLLEEHGHRAEARSFPCGFLFMRLEMIGRIGIILSLERMK